jgi:hypothetical protein
MSISIDRLAEQYYAPYDPEFRTECVRDAVTGELVDPEDVTVGDYDGLYFTADTFSDFVEDHPDLLDEYLDEDDPLADYDVNPSHMREMVDRAGRSMFGREWEKRYGRN